MTRFVAGLLLLLCQSGVALAQAAPTSGLQSDVRFDTPSPEATNHALLERLLSPRRQQRQRAALAAAGQALAPSPLDLAAEHFAVYVPKQRPAAGYGLLVFIPPWQDARLPSGWARALDRAGVIFVTAARSGNEESIPGRRVPLALTAASALARLYPLDPDRRFIGGFSGGSRVALMVAMAYPDLFTGVLLDAGSDPVGTADIPLPPPALMALLQTRTRFVFVTGANDEANLAKDAEARASLASWCIETSRTYDVPNLGHAVTDASALLVALDALSRPHRPDPSRCRATLETRLTQARAEAAAFRAQPSTAATEAALDRLDRTYGALLDPR